MRTLREASNTAALTLFRPALKRSADFVKRSWASRSVAASFSERSATVRAPAECARSPFAVLKEMKPQGDSLKWRSEAREPPAPSAGKSWRELAQYRSRELVTGSGRSRAVSRLAATASLQAEAAIGCEPSLFLVGQVRPFALERLTRNRGLVYLMLKA